MSLRLGFWRSYMMWGTVIGMLLFTSPAFSTDDVLLRHMQTVLDFVGMMSASCVQHYEEGMTPEALAN
jgi:hypothetical protein